jgi:hypothetical protein
LFQAGRTGGFNLIIQGTLSFAHVPTFGMGDTPPLFRALPKWLIAAKDSSIQSLKATFFRQLTQLLLRGKINCLHWANGVKTLVNKRWCQSMNFSSNISWQGTFLSFY